MFKIENKEIHITRGDTGTILVNNEQLSISNLEEYFEAHKDIANSLGYYDYIEEVKPIYNNDTEYLSISYELRNNTIYASYLVNDYTAEELEQMNAITGE